MGTSTNHPSPKAPSWNLAKARLGNEQEPVAQQSGELWRAATTDPDADLVARLSGPSLVQACKLATAINSPIEAGESFDKYLAGEKQSGLFLDLARRALVRAVAARSGSPGFAGELFAEVISYYASRDLPSIVGSTGRIGNISAVLTLKKELSSIARNAASDTAFPRLTTEAWTKYVDQVIAKLRRDTSGG